MFLSGTGQSQKTTLRSISLKGSALQCKQQPEVKRLLLLAPPFGTFLFLSSISACLHSAQIQLKCISSNRPSVQFSRSVVSNSLRPMNCSTPGLPVHYQLLEFTQTHVHRVGDAIQPSHPLSSPSPPALNLSQNQGLFK